MSLFCYHVGKIYLSKKNITYYANLNYMCMLIIDFFDVVYVFSLSLRCAHTLKVRHLTIIRVACSVFLSLFHTIHCIVCTARVNYIAVKIGASFIYTVSSLPFQLGSKAPVGGEHWFCPTECLVFISSSLNNASSLSLHGAFLNNATRCT